MVLDGKLFHTDRLAGTTTSAKGEQIDAWYSGKHRAFGAGCNGSAITQQPPHLAT